MLDKDHTPYPKAGISCPDSRLYLVLIFKFAILVVEVASLVMVTLISPFDAQRASVSATCKVFCPCHLLLEAT